MESHQCINLHIGRRRRRDVITYEDLHMVMSISYPFIIIFSVYLWMKPCTYVAESNGIIKRNGKRKKVQFYRFRARD